MITILHGQDTESSYRRLTELLLKFPDHTKIYIDKNSTVEKIHEALFGQSLTGDEEIVIFEDLANLDVLKILEKQTPQKEVIFYTKQELKSNILKNLPKNVKVEVFKKTSPIFAFLDSLVPKSQSAFAQIYGQDHLLWHIENRILLLILAKMGIETKKIEQITGRLLQDWQIRKIKNQAAKFEKASKLLALYSGTLKVDYLIKTGKTSLDQETLTSILLLKYLR